MHVPVEHGEVQSGLSGKRAGPPGAGAVLLEAHGATGPAVVIPPRAHQQVLDAPPNPEWEASFGIIQRNAKVLTALSLL